MKNPQQPGREMVAFLADLLTRGWKAYLVAEKINRLRGNRHPLAAEFFDITEEACLGVAILSLAELTDMDYKLNDSISVYALLDYSVSSSKAFPGMPGMNVREFVKTRKSQLAGFKTVIENVRIWRDQIIVHPDAKAAERPDHIQPHPIYGAETANVFAALLAILSSYKTFLQDADEIVLPSRNLPRDLAIEVEGVFR